MDPFVICRGLPTSVEASPISLLGVYCWRATEYLFRNYSITLAAVVTLPAWTNIPRVCVWHESQA